MKRVFLVAAIFIFALPGQEVSGKRAVIFNTGYYLEQDLPVYTVPGQLLSLSVHGVGQGIRDSIVAKGFPLPTKLAGISVTVNRFPAPLLGIIAHRTCRLPFCGQFVTIILQVPFEYRGGIGPGSEALIVYEDDDPVVYSSASIRSSWVHVFTPMNTLGLVNTLIWLFPESQDVAKKRDGTWASRFNTAKPGEELTLYAVGLGLSRDSSVPLPASGMPSPAGYQVDVGILFDFGENPKARPVMYDPWIGGPNKPPPMEGLIWAGLAGGKVGIYEVRFRVPETIPEGTPSCRESHVSHNLMVSIGSIARSPRFVQPTYDGAGICVEVPRDLTAAQ
jgi:uncharacterized protein (TIGR03437 family)